MTRSSLQLEILISAYTHRYSGTASIKSYIYQTRKVISLWWMSTMRNLLCIKKSFQMRK